MTSATDDGKASWESGNGAPPTPDGAPPTPEQTSGPQQGDKKLMTIDDAVDEIGTGRFQRRILFASGLCFAADSAEVMLLSFLSLLLQDEWGLSSTQSATITSVVFAGALTGTLILGRLGDVLGRRPVFLASALIISVLGFLTAAVNGFYSLLVVRFLVGFGVGGITVPFDIMAEFLPTDTRGRYLSAIEYFWSVGSLFVPIVAYLTIGQGMPWQIFVFVCALPCVISFVVGICAVPESPRWLLSRGRATKALTILRDAARINGKDPDGVFPANTEILVEEEESSNFRELLSPKWRKITLLLWGVWITYAFSYYGTVMLNTRVFEEDEEDENGDEEVSVTAHFDYEKIVIAASAEIVGLYVAIKLVDRVGRISTQVVAYGTGGIVSLLLCIVANARQTDTMLLPLSFLARMMEMMGNNVTWIQTAEILTTEIRTTGHSAANAMARLGALSAPFVVSGKFSYVTVGIVMFLVHSLTALLVTFLPETQGKGMGQVAKEKNTVVTQELAEVPSDGDGRKGSLPDLS